MRILVVEDNAALANGIAKTLEASGFAVDIIGDGQEADSILKVQSYDLVVLDINLPTYDGLKVLKNLRHYNKETQVLMLTARDQLQDRVSGLDLGADDYMTKPFELEELEARIRALLRRVSGYRSPQVEVGALRYDSVARRVEVNGETLNLPKRELTLLEIFLAHRGKVISKEKIADSLANFDDEITLNAVEIYISRLRKKIKEAGLSIKTVRGLGYLLEAP